MEIPLSERDKPAGLLSEPKQDMEVPISERDTPRKDYNEISA